MGIYPWKKTANPELHAKHGYQGQDFLYCVYHSPIRLRTQDGKIAKYGNVPGN